MQVNFADALSISGCVDYSLDEIKEETNLIDYDQSFPCDNSGIASKALYPEQYVELINAFKCEKCDKVFSTIIKLNRHIKSHSTDKPFPCIKCSKRFRVSQELRRHDQTHTGEKPFTCSECTKAYADSSSLRLHWRTHTGVKPYECNKCGRLFIHSKQYACS